MKKKSSKQKTNFVDTKFGAIVIMAVTGIVVGLYIISYCIGYVLRKVSQVPVILSYMLMWEWKKVKYLTIEIFQV